MSTTITTRLERRVEADPSGMTVTDTTDGQSIMVALTRAQAGELAAALDPERDFSGVDWKAMYEQALRKKGEAFDRAVRAERERDAAVAHAEALDKQLAKVMSDYQDVEDECDEWKARAEKAERDRDESDQ